MTVLTNLAPLIPALDVIVAGGVGVAIAAIVVLYGRRHEQWSRGRRDPR